MPHLILVKHALPAIIPTLPANQWHLSEIGRAQCALLADQLATYVPDALVSSSEPKALETAHLVAQKMHMSVQVVDGLQEHDRSNTPWLDPEEFDRAVAAFFRHPTELVLGGETAHQASERFARTMAKCSVSELMLRFMLPPSDSLVGHLRTPCDGPRSLL